MKGILVFDKVNDVIFVESDDSFNRHLTAICRRNGLLDQQIHNDINNASSSSIPEQIFNSDILTKDAIVHLFSPLLTSQRVMQDEFANPYRTLECEDGMMLAISEFHSYQIISIAVKEETCMLHQHRLHVFENFAALLYGPSLNILKDHDSCRTDKKHSRALLLLQLLHKWDRLQSQEQMFLVEAADRLIINRTLSKRCISLVQAILEKTCSICQGRETACHILVLAGIKILALHSSRHANKLSKTDLLLIIVLIQVLCPNLGSPNTKEGTNSLGHDNQNLNTGAPSGLSGRISPSIEVTEDTLFEDSLNSEAVHLHHELVFLKSQQGLLIPHMVHTVSIQARVVLVIISELSTSSLAIAIGRTMDVLHLLSSNLNQHQRLDMLESLKDGANTILEASKNFKCRSDFYIRNLQIKWDLLCQAGLESFMQSNKSEISSRLEAAASALCTALHDFFGQHILKAELCYQLEVPVELLVTLSRVEKFAKYKLGDYMDYIEARASMNISMTSYYQAFPGLIHFLYIDRTTNYLLAPELNLPQNEEPSCLVLLKHKVWKMMEFAHSSLQKGRLSMMWKEEDFYYSYFIYLEDASGRVITPDKDLQLKHVEHLPLPGVLCGNFYRLLLKQFFPNVTTESIQCYELYCIHLSVVPRSAIIDHGRRLVVSLWEISGDILHLEPSIDWPGFLFPWT